MGPSHHRLPVAAAALICGFAAQFLHAQTPWYQWRRQKQANFHDIQKAHDAEPADDASAGDRDLTRILQPNQMPLREGESPFEDEEDFQYRRWAAFVAPRTAPSGDLALIDSGQQTIADLVLAKTAAAPAYGAWESLGPGAAGTYGAGRLDWIAFHPTDPNTFMVGSPSGGLWLTHDGGSTWTTPTDGIAVLGAAWAAYDPVHPDTIYLATGDGDHSDTYSVGVLKSTDGGATWNTTGLTYPVANEMEIEKLEVDGKNPRKIYVATSRGVQVSNDAGASFQASSGINGQVWDVEINPADSNIVYATTTSLYVSHDGGASFMRNSNLASAAYRMQIAVTAAQPGYVYALRGADTSTQGVYLSQDSGQTFTQTGSGSVLGCAQTWYDYGFDANPTNANQLAAGCLEAYQSNDGGASWIQLGSSYHVDVHGTMYRSDGTLYNLDDGGIFVSAGTTRWTNLNNNLIIGQAYRVGIYPGDYDQLCSGRQDNATDIRNATTGTWKSALGGDGFGCFWNNTGTRWYGESEDGTGEGCNYANGQVSGCRNINIQAPLGTWDNPWAPDPNSSSGLFNARTTDLWHSTNNGSNWTQMGTIGGSGTILNFVVAPSNSNVLYVFKGGAIYQTTDQGGTWKNVKGSISGTVVNGDVSDTNPDDVWVTVSGYSATSKVYHSTDGGTNWTNETRTGLPNLPANCIALDNLGHNGLYLGMDVGVYFKRDSMTSWINYSAGLPNASIHDLKIGSKGTSLTDRRLVAATFGRSIWRTVLYDQAPTAARNAVLPDLNAFTATLNGATLLLRFQLATGADDPQAVRIQLVTVTGETVYRESVPARGLFQRQIDLSRSGKGLYLFVLSRDGRRVTRRIAYE